MSENIDLFDLLKEQQRCRNKMSIECFDQGNPGSALMQVKRGILMHHPEADDDAIYLIIDQSAGKFLAEKVISDRKDAAGKHLLYMSELERSMTQVLNAVAATPQFTAMPEAVQALALAVLQTVEKRRVL